MAGVIWNCWLRAPGPQEQTEQCFLPLLGLANVVSYDHIWLVLLGGFPTDGVLAPRAQEARRDSLSHTLSSGFFFFKPVRWRVKMGACPQVKSCKNWSSLNSISFSQTLTSLHWVFFGCLLYLFFSVLFGVCISFLWEHWSNRKYSAITGSRTS